MKIPKEKIINTKSIQTSIEEVLLTPAVELICTDGDTNSTRKTIKKTLDKYFHTRLPLELMDKVTFGEYVYAFNDNVMLCHKDPFKGIKQYSNELSSFAAALSYNLDSVNNLGDVDLVLFDTVCHEMDCSSMIPPVHAEFKGKKLGDVAGELFFKTHEMFCSSIQGEEYINSVVDWIYQSMYIYLLCNFSLATVTVIPFMDKSYITELKSRI